MQLTMLITADYASVEQGTGKLNILGAFTRILARDFPVRHRRMAVVVQIRPELGDSPDEHILRVLLTDADEAEILQVSGPFSLPHRKGEGPRPDFNAVLEINDLIFPYPGTYKLAVFSDDVQLNDTPIEVVAIQKSE